MIDVDKKIKFAVLYDYLQVAGGSERMALDLCAGLPDAALIVSRIFPEAQSLIDNDSASIKTLGDGLTKHFGRIIESAYCFKYRCQFLKNAETIYYLGNYAPLSVHDQLQGKKIYYCNTPPRFAYDWNEAYRLRQPRTMRPLFDYCAANYRRAYEQALSKMDVVIANSVNIQRRIKKYLGIDSQVIYPPVNTHKYQWQSQGDYFISTARLMPYKRIDMIVDAFRQLPKQRLVVLSGGPELRNLKQLAQGSTNISFTGWQSEADLQHWISNARGVIYIPQEEDFGISPVEAMAAGKPVIGVAEGGLLETIVHEQTGLLLPANPSVADLIDAIQRLDSRTVLDMRAACEARAQLFSRNIFLQKMLALTE